MALLLIWTSSVFLTTPWKEFDSTWLAKSTIVNSTNVAGELEEVYGRPAYTNSAPEIG
jgi:hypothetical protein